MTLALRSPDAVANIVAVDNAPVDAALRNDFAHYIRGMEKIQSAGITRQAEADQILQKYEEVRSPTGPGNILLVQRQNRGPR